MFRAWCWTFKCSKVRHTNCTKCELQRTGTESLGLAIEFFAGDFELFEFGGDDLPLVIGPLEPFPFTLALFDCLPELRRPERRLVLSSITNSSDWMAGKNLSLLVTCGRPSLVPIIRSFVRIFRFDFLLIVTQQWWAYTVDTYWDDQVNREANYRSFSW